MARLWGISRRKRLADAPAPVAPVAPGPDHLFCHISACSSPPGFMHFWERVRAEVAAAAPSLHEDADPQLGSTHRFASTGGCTPALRVSLPPGAASLAEASTIILSLHGYGADGSLADAAAFRGSSAALARVHVRGFPGSVDPAGESGPFMMRRIADRAAWSLTGAVADVLCACHALRAAAGSRARLVLHGESFGGALAIIAASQLTGHDAVDRLIVGVPSLGDWAWRFANDAGAGAGREVVDHLASNPADADLIRSNLALFDTVVHARRIAAPVLMKFARSDPVVPPRTVSAIYNALGTSPGHKWRFITETAHDPAPSADDLRRHALFNRIAAEFAVARDPAECMAQWESALLP